MEKIEVAKIIGKSLDSRDQAQKLFAIIKNKAQHDSNVTLNFGNVEFMSRSFADQFYQETTQIGIGPKITLSLEDANSQIVEILDAVSKTQFARKSVNNLIKVYSFREMSNLKDYLLGI